MISKKYLSDYKVEPYLDEKGRVRNKTTYVGVYYKYINDDKTRKNGALLYLLATIGVILSFVIPLSFKSEIADLGYVVLPYAFVFLAIVFMIGAVFNVLTIKAPMIRENGEKINARVSACPIIVIILEGFALLASLASAIFGVIAIGLYEVIFIIFMIFGIASAILAFLLKKRLKTEPVNE